MHLSVRILSKRGAIRFPLPLWVAVLSILRRILSAGLVDRSVAHEKFISMRVPVHTGLVGSL